MIKLTPLADGQSWTQFLTKYLPYPRTLSPHDANMMRIWDARDLALDVDKFFNQYVLGVQV